MAWNLLRSFVAMCLLSHHGPALKIHSLFESRWINEVWSLKAYQQYRIHRSPPDRFDNIPRLLPHIRFANAIHLDFLNHLDQQISSLLELCSIPYQHSLLPVFIYRSKRTCAAQHPIPAAKIRIKRRNGPHSLIRRFSPVAQAYNFSSRFNLIISIISKKK